MSRIDELIKKYCPDGVRYQPLGDACKIETGKRDANEAVEGAEYLFFTTSREILTIDEFRWDTEALLIAGNANVGDIKHYIGKFDAYQRTYVLSNFNKDLMPRFLFYSIKSRLKDYLGDKTNTAAMTYIVLGTLKNFPIPVPPIEVQREIVDILDKFTQLEAELEAELEARRKQYEYYRNELLSFKNVKGVRTMCLSDLLVAIPRGKRLTKSNLSEGGSIPVFHGGLDPIGFHDEANTPGETVMVINTGASSGTVGWTNEPFWCSDGCFALPHSEAVLSRYLYYCALQNQQYFVDRVRKAGIPTLAASSVLALQIPVPPIEVQREIVEILDRFSTLTSDISIGLPAEIEARRKQYEFYRDQLLSFKELDVA